MRRFLWFAGLLATSVCELAPARATPYDLFTLDDPDASRTTLTGVNNAGVIVGNDYSASGAVAGFTYAGAVFTPVTLPGYSGLVEADGINDFGTIVGRYQPAGGPVFGGTLSFILSGSVLTPLDLGEDFFGTAATGINNGGDTVSSVFYTPSSVLGYLALADGTVTRIPVPPEDPDTIYAFALPDGLNDADAVVGVETAVGGAETLVYRSGVSTYFNPPDGYQSVGYDINNLGQIVGSYQDFFGSTFGYVDTDGSFQTIVFPGATATAVTGINDRGEIIGTYQDAAGEHGFYGVPDAMAVPEPATLPIFAGAVASLMLIRRTRRPVNASVGSTIPPA